MFRFGCASVSGRRLIDSRWFRTGQASLSDSKKKGGVPQNGPVDRRSVGIRPDLVSKIVQIRTSSTQNAPPPPPSTPPPPSKPPAEDSTESSNSLRNIIIGLVLAAASIGGVYYSGILDNDPKKSPSSSSQKDKKPKQRPVKRYPESKLDFPEKIPYVLIGGGTASFAAFRAIKSKDRTAKVLIISGEDSMPYMRPPLSKEIWQRRNLPNDIENLSFLQWNGQERSLYYEPPEFYLDIKELSEAPNGGVTVVRGWIVSKVDPTANTVTVEDPVTGKDFQIHYEKCLIATGSVPKNLPIFENASKSIKERTVLYRNIRDLENLWNKIENAKSVAIVGGGFLGSELACSLGRKFKESSKAKVYQVFKEPGNMGRILPEYLSKWTTDRIVEEGVEVIPGAEVQVVQMDNNKVLLNLSNGGAIRSDVVIVAVGSEPCTQLAESSMLELDPKIGGFLVNAELEARTNLYVAGDAACFYDPILGRRRVEHHDHAVVSGRLAGENMAGSSKPYKHQSMFWSDLGPEIGYEAIGVVDADLPTVAVFAKSAEAEKPIDKKADEPENTSDENSSKKIRSSETRESENVLDRVSNQQIAIIKEDKPKDPNTDYSKGVIFYLKNEMIVGIVLWNVFNKMHTARQVLAERTKYKDLNEVAKLFNIHEN